MHISLCISIYFIYILHFTKKGRFLRSFLVADCIDFLHILGYHIKVKIYNAGVLDMMKNTDKTMEKIVALCKGRGFIFAGSEIYGGLANTWDYGPLGARMKNNVKDTWRKRFIQERKNSYEVDADILMHPRVWEYRRQPRSCSFFPE